MSSEPVLRRHGGGCQCVRCVEFQPGNEFGRRFEAGNQVGQVHGAYAAAPRIFADPETTVLADEFFACLPVRSPAFRPACELLAVTTIRIRRAALALAAVDNAVGSNALLEHLSSDADSFARLRQDLRAWIGQARRLMADLGLTASSQVALGVGLSATELARERFRAHVAERYGEES